MDAKNNKLGQEGQALVEFLMFFPFMLMMYSVTISIGNAINASINQQKIARSYLYYRVQNDSNVPKPSRDGNEVHTGWDYFGMYMIGWRDQFINSVPTASCFKFRIPLGNSEEDKCTDGYNQTSTQFIRVGTVYGICGATYKKDTNAYVRQPGPNYFAGTFTAHGCTIK